MKKVTWSSARFFHLWVRSFIGQRSHLPPAGAERMSPPLPESPGADGRSQNQGSVSPHWGHELEILGDLQVLLKTFG